MSVERSHDLDILDFLVQRGIVIDPWAQVQPAGINLLGGDLRLVVASTDTFPRPSEVTGGGPPLARQASELESLLLGSTSGALQIALTDIRGRIELLLQGAAGPLSPEQRANIDRIEASARHLLELIKAMES